VPLLFGQLDHRLYCTRLSTVVVADMTQARACLTISVANSAGTIIRV
jgi:hypothetical protein